MSAASSRSIRWWMRRASGSLTKRSLHSRLTSTRPSFPPLFLARAGRDAIPTLNARLDAFVGSAIAANAPITIVNHPTGAHGFDVANDDERSREIIRAALEFMKAHLNLA